MSCNQQLDKDLTFTGCRNTLSLQDINKNQCCQFSDVVARYGDFLDHITAAGYTSWSAGSLDTPPVYSLCPQQPIPDQHCSQHPITGNHWFFYRRNSLFFVLNTIRRNIYKLKKVISSIRNRFLCVLSWLLLSWLCFVLSAFLKDIIVFCKYVNTLWCHDQKWRLSSFYKK